MMIHRLFCGVSAISGHTLLNPECHACYQPTSWPPTADVSQEQCTMGAYDIFLEMKTSLSVGRAQKSTRTAFSADVHIDKLVYCLIRLVDLKKRRNFDSLNAEANGTYSRCRHFVSVGVASVACAVGYLQQNCELLRCYQWPQPLS